MESETIKKPEPFSFQRIPLKASVSYLLSNIATSEEYVACLRSCDTPPRLEIFQLKNKFFHFFSEIHPNLNKGLRKMPNFQSSRNRKPLSFHFIINLSEIHGN